MTQKKAVQRDRDINVSDEESWNVVARKETVILEHITKYTQRYPTSETNRPQL